MTRVCRTTDALRTHYMFVYTSYGGSAGFPLTVVAPYTRSCPPAKRKMTGQDAKGAETPAPEKVEIMTDSEHAGVEEIRLIDNSTYVPKVIPTYVALGFLEEYADRELVEGGEIVETLFPSERQHVRGFVSILRDIAGEQNIATHIRQEVRPGGHIAIISRELTAYLDSLYLPMLNEASNFTDTDGRERRSIRAGIRGEMFPEIRSREYKPDEVDCRFSFLLGCHIRYGKNNSFKLANAPHKVQLIVEFLERLGASWIKWSWTVGTAPVGHRIEFGPDAVLTRFLGLVGDFGTWE